ncbi:hypothetical protein Hesp01_00120 [Herbidospora sp. NBRC 101105]|nr:hypothetical protein Hesp01_00120 [Herbidospora sp. NBRC 101105]
MSAPSPPPDAVGDGEALRDGDGVADGVFDAAFAEAEEDGAGAEAT